MDNNSNGQQPQMGQPMGGYQQPQMDQPMGGYQQPQMNQPMGGYQQPQMNQPMGGYQQPQMNQPMGGYQQPQMNQPMGGYQQPQMNQPMGGYQQPQMNQPMGGYQQPQMNQPMGGYQQPMTGGGFNSAKFASDMQTNYMKLMGLVGALLIFIAPFFHWFSVKMKYDGESEKEAYNLFKLASDDGIDKGVFAFFAVMMLIIGIVLVAMELSDYMPALYNIKMKIPYVQYVEIGLVALVLLFWLLAFFNGDLMDGIKAGKDMIKALKAWMDGVKGHCNHGIGPIISMIGIIASAFPRVTKLITGK